MKLLFDENLSPKLPRLLAAHFPSSLHLRDCGLKGATDEEIWEYAGANGFTIVSKDSDFYQRSLFYGSPPKFVWLRIVAVGEAGVDKGRRIVVVMSARPLALQGAPVELSFTLSPYVFCRVREKNAARS